MNKPLVSIIIPVYNNERFISQSISSALEQSYEPIEVIVVNDGSTDNTLSIIESFGDKILVLNQKNKGAGAARNTGLAHASGTYIKFLDGDDILEKNIISKQIESSLKMGNKKAIVYGHYHLIDQYDRISIPKKYLTINDWEDPIAFLILNDYIVTTCPLHKKEYLDKYGGFTEEFFPGEDPELHLRLYLNGVDLIYKNDLVYYYRQYKSNTRLSSQRWPDKKPSLGKRQLELYEKEIFDKLKKPNNKILRAIGNKHFKYGVILYKANNKELANYHFKKAKSFLVWFQYAYANNQMKGIVLYTLMRLFGKNLTFKRILKSKQYVQQ